MDGATPDGASTSLSLVSDAPGVAELSSGAVVLFTSGSVSPPHAVVVKINQRPALLPRLNIARVSRATGGASIGVNLHPTARDRCEAKRPGCTGN